MVDIVRVAAPWVAGLAQRLPGRDRAIRRGFRLGLLQAQ